MDGCQAEVDRAIQDLWTQVTSWKADTDSYANTAAWVWERIARTESTALHRQAVWWTGMVVALVIRAALRNLSNGPGDQGTGPRSSSNIQHHSGRRDYGPDAL